MQFLFTIEELESGLTEFCTTHSLVLNKIFTAEMWPMRNLTLLSYRRQWEVDNPDINSMEELNISLPNSQGKTLNMNVAQFWVYTDKDELVEEGKWRKKQELDQIFTKYLKKKSSFFFWASASERLDKLLEC